MSDKLGGIPYPRIDPGGALETNPLAKYTKQLDPLAKLTDQLWQTPRAPGLAPIQPPMTALSLAQLADTRRQQGIMPPPTPGVVTPPASGLPASSAEAAQPGWRSTPWRDQPSSALAAAGAPAAAPAAAPPGGPADVTQFQQDPTTGVIKRGALARRLAAQTMDVPTYGSEALAQAGGVPGAPTSPDQEPEQSRSDLRISTRIPSEPAQAKAGINAHETSGLSIDLDSMNRATDQKAKNAAIIKQHYPGFEHLRTDDPSKINEAFINHAKDNLKWLYNKMNDEKGPIGPGIVERAKRWYSGANKIAHNLAKEYGVQPHVAAAVLAALSPQKDWYQNVDLARRAFNAHKLGNNWTMTDKMQDYSAKYIAQLEKDANDPKKPKANPAMLEKLKGLQQKFRETPMSALTDPFERAVFARWHDEAHNPRDYKMVTPEGGFGETSMVPAKYHDKGKRKGKLKEAARPRDVTWGSFSEIGKAMAALQNADLPTVSRLMGGAHKVRNFYNNIIAPGHGHDVTIDTHAIAAALLRPLGAGAMEVAHGLGTNPKQPKGDPDAPRLPQAGDSATLGNKGMYGLYAEAYRRAAKDLGIMPRELQSVTWEGVRGLFSPEQKRNKTFVGEVADMWRNKGAHRGKTPDERREAIVSHAGGLKPPSWAGGQDYGEDAEE
jgi:hypothetical protein